MSAFHHKAMLLGSANEICRYQFQPSFLDAPDASGIFCLNITTMEWTIELTSGHAMEERAITAVIHKIKRSLIGGDAPPQTVTFVA